MDSEHFAVVVGWQMKVCEDVLIDKARMYATDDDRLHNFKVSAIMQDITVQAAIAGMMAKHTVSIYDMCVSDEIFDAEIWNEKITDHINYLLLLQAAVHEERDDESQLTLDWPEGISHA